MCSKDPRKSIFLIRENSTQLSISRSDFARNQIAMHSIYNAFLKHDIW